MATTTRTRDEQREASVKVQDIRGRLESWFSATHTLRERIRESFDFNIGGRYQWKSQDITQLEAEHRPVQSFNVGGAIINFVAGYQLERETDYRIFPRGVEDEQLGRLATALLKYCMDVSRGVELHGTLFRHGVTGGQSVIEIGHSYEFTDDLLEGECSQDVLPENAWYHEIGARRYDRNDAVFMGKLMWFTQDAAIQKWPQHRSSFLVTNRSEWMSQDPHFTGVPEQLRRELYDEKSGRIRIGQHWYRVPVEVSLVVNTATGDIQRMPSEKAAEDFIRTIYDTAGRTVAAQFRVEKATNQSALLNNVTGQYTTYRRPEQAAEALALLTKQAGRQAIDIFQLVTRPTTALRVCHFIGWELLDDGPAPTGSDWRYPFVPFTCYQDTDDFASIKGLWDDIKDPQREINWHHATMLDSIIRGPKGGVWLNKADQQNIPKLKQEYSRAGFIGEYSGQPPIPIAPGMANQADLAMLQFGIDAIMRISGVNAEMMGQTTQKTVSGRAIGARQAGGLVGLGTVFANWQWTKRLIGELLIRRIQSYYSPEKMNRIIGQNQRMAQQAGLVEKQVIPDVVMFDYFKRLKQIDVDVVVDFQEASPTARHAVSAQLLQLQAAGFPIPPEVILEAADIPYKQEVLAALQAQGQQPPNPELAKVVSAGQGQSAPVGVNQTA